VEHHEVTHTQKTKWFISIALLLSIFSFTGFVSYASPLPQVVQTELVESHTNTSTRKTVHFIARSVCQYIPTTYYVAVLIDDNRSAAIQLKKNHIWLAIKEDLCIFYKPKSMTIGSDEDLSTPLIG